MKINFVQISYFLLSFWFCSVLNSLPKGIGKSCKNQKDCEESSFDKGLICTETNEGDKVCKSGKYMECDKSDNNCARDLICYGEKKNKIRQVCIYGCISEANCEKGKVCRGYIPYCINTFGLCYTKKEAGSKDTRCSWNPDCKAGYYCDISEDFYCSGKCTKK